jgi:hypothetical protein
VRYTLRQMSRALTAIAIAIALSLSLLANPVRADELGSVTIVLGKKNVVLCGIGWGTAHPAIIFKRWRSQRARVESALGRLGTRRRSCTRAHVDLPTPRRLLHEARCS